MVANSWFTMMSVCCACAARWFARLTSCVEKAANHLRDEGFFSEKTAAGYAEKAKTADLQPKQDTAIVIHKKKGEGA